jgi:hypothetical protein
MGRMKQLHVYDTVTKLWKVYESGIDFVAKHPEYCPSTYGNAKARQGLLDNRYAFADADHVQLIMDNMDELLTKGKITSIKFPREVTLATQKLYIYDINTDTWMFHKNSLYAQRHYNEFTRGTWENYIDEEKLLGERYLVKSFYDGIQHEVDNITIPGYNRKPKNKKEEMELRKQMNMFPYGKFEKYYKDGKLLRKEWNEFLVYCEQLADAEDGRRQVGIAKRIRVAAFDWDTKEYYGVWNSILDAQEATGVTNVSKILAGKLEYSHKHNMGFRKLEEGEEIEVTLELDEEAIQYGQYE